MATVTQRQQIGLEDIEWFEGAGKRRAPHYDFPTVRIDASGQMVLNRSAVDDLGNPTHVTLGLSRRLRLIALRPSTAQQISAYKIKQVSPDSFRVNSSGFMKVHGLNHMRRNTYTLSMAQGMGLIATDSEPVVPS